MTTCKHVLALGGCLLLSAASVVQADTTKASDVQTELSVMRSRIAQLEGQQNQSWLNERRAEEVKSLVREVLSDADTRASLADGGSTAGVDKDGAFLASEDGRYLVRINGQVQFRYSYNAREGNQDNTGNSDKNDGMFSSPRTKLMFSGHIADPRIKFHVQLAAYNGEGDHVELEGYKLSYDLADGLTVWGGLVKAPLVRGSIISTSKTLAAGRGTFEGIFNRSNTSESNRVEGVGVTYLVKDAVRINAMVTDGSGSEFGLIARAEYKVFGEWDQLEDFSAWSGEGQLLAMSLSGAYSEADHGHEHGFAYGSTVVADVSYENNGLGVYVAGGVNSGESGNNTYQTYGVTAQANYFFIADKLEAFARYDYIDVRNGDTFNLATIGANYYLNKHNAKFTLDLQYAPRAVNADFTQWDSGLNDDDTSGNGNRNQVTIRGQFQLLF